MKKYFLLISLLLSCVVYAQLPTQKTLLWELSGKGMKQASYLFGTIHLMCAKDLKMPDVVRKKFELSKQLFLEVKLDDPDLMMTMTTLMVMKNSMNLKTLLGNRYDSVSKAFQAMSGIPLAFINTTKPALLVSAIYPALLGCKLAIWEKVFEEMAIKKRMEIKGLETIADQMNALDAIPYQQQADMFAKEVLEKDSSKIELNEMLETYRQKNIEKMNLLTTETGELKNFEETLLTKRNSNWIPIIEREAKQQPTFFAFGAAHLAGKNGVIYLLRKAGYIVKPIMY